MKLAVIATFYIAFFLCFGYGKKTDPKNVYPYGPDCNLKVAVTSCASSGHINPMLGTVEELASRGCDVTFYITEGDEKYITPIANMKNVKIVKASPVKFSNETLELKKETGKGGNPLFRIKGAMKMFMESSAPLYDTLKPICSDPKTRPDVLYVDFATYMPVYLCDELQLSCVINIPGLIFGSELSFDHSPIFGSGSPLTFSLSQRFMNRVSYAFIEFLFFIIDYSVTPIFGEGRFSKGFVPKSLPTYIQLYPAIIDTVPGFDYPQPIRPGWVMTGNVQMKEKPLMTKELQEWIDSSDEPIVYVSMGTVVNVMPETYRNMANALNKLKCRVLWSLRDNQRENLPVTKSHIRIEPFVAQQHVLEHPKVKLFVSHGGANSVIESLSSQTPMICIPFMADQFDMCARAKNRGAAEVIHSEFEEHELVEPIEKVLSNESYSAAAEKLSKIFYAGGGAKAAADHIMRIGTIGILPTQMQHLHLPAWQRWNLDLYLAIFVFLVFLRFVFKAIVFVFRKLWQRTTKSKKD